jgi:hypothetical protein
MASLSPANLSIITVARYMVNGIDFLFNTFPEIRSISNFLDVVDDAKYADLAMRNAKDIKDYITTKKEKNIRFIIADFIGNISGVIVWLNTTKIMNLALSSLRWISGVGNAFFIYSRGFRVIASIEDVKKNLTLKKIALLVFNVVFLAFAVFGLSKTLF